MSRRTFIAVTVLVAAMVLPGALLANNGKKIKRSQLPQAVQTSLDTHYPDTKVKSIVKTTQNEQFQSTGRAAQEQGGTGGAGNPNATTGGSTQPSSGGTTDNGSSTAGGTSGGTQPKGSRAQQMPGEPGGPVYLVAMETNGEQLITTFDEQGNILEEDVIVPIESTPAAVQSAFQQSPQGRMKVRNASKITRGSESPLYEIVVMDNGVPIHIIYDENGQMVSTTRGNSKNNSDKTKNNNNNNHSNH
jgi:hypothetical protein